MISTKEVCKLLKMSRRQLQTKMKNFDLTPFYEKGEFKNSHIKWHEDKVKELKKLITKKTK